MSVIIEKCLDRAIKHSHVDQEMIELEALELKARREKLLGIETRAKEEIDARLNELRTIHAQQTTAAEVGYAPRIDPVVFSWRNKQEIKHRRCAIPAPALMLFSLSSPETSIRAEDRGSPRFRPEVPDFVEAKYKDVIFAMDYVVAKRRLSSIEIKSVFDGVIPDETREKIVAAGNSGTYQKLYLLAETPEWKVASVERPKPQLIDPIVVGLQADALWVIDVFDPTPVESYVAAEFTV